MILLSQLGLANSHSLVLGLAIAEFCLSHSLVLGLIGLTIFSSFLLLLSFQLHNISLEWLLAAS